MTNQKQESSPKNAQVSEYKKIRKQYEQEFLEKKIELLASILDTPLKHIKGCTYNPAFFRNNIENPIGIVQIPLGLIGPLKVNGGYACGEYFVPMATTEGALILTYDLGARLLDFGSPVDVSIESNTIHLDPMFILENDDQENKLKKFIKDEFTILKSIAESKSSHTTLISINPIRIGSSLVLKTIYNTHDAHGLNMINEATYNYCKYISEKTTIKFYHRSHYSGVKHHSLLNERCGYGRRVKASAIVTSKALSLLKVDAFEMKDFFDRCVECGSAAGINSVNVHAANAIAAIYLACGQDAADISSSSVCETKVKIVNNKDLYIESTLKNLLVATVGGGTGLGTQSECLRMMGCLGSNKADKFAEIIAATVLVGEFPTAAAVINESYVEIHNKYGRNKSKKFIQHE